MVDEFKALKETLLKTVYSAVTGENDAKTAGLKEVITTLATLAGKGKDEIVQIISREIGVALAAALKEPMTDALKDKRLRVTFEFIPDKPQPKSKTKKKAKTSKTKPSPPPEDLD